jgi:Domain of unknown function (DUF4956)
MFNNIIFRLIVFYAVLIAGLSGLFVTFPVLGDYVAAERARQGGRASLELDRLPEALPVGPELTGPAQLLDPERTVPIVLSILIAVLISLPVVWVYRWTRPRWRYNQTFAHTLLVVPIAITLVVFLVKGSLALAFSLAGIVAAVRFRTTLDEPMDAVYLFLVIGTGLAAGVQLLVVALISSIMFNAVALTVWRLNVGGQAVALDGWNLVPAAPGAPIPAAAGMARPDPAGGEEDAGDPFNARLCLHVTQAEEAQRFAVPFLQERAKKWRLADVTHEADGTSVIEFDLRLKKSVDLAAFVRDLEQGDPHVKRVELMRSKSKKPKD